MIKKIGTGARLDIENLTPATLLKLVSTGPGHKQDTTTCDLSLLNSSYIAILIL